MGSVTGNFQSESPLHPAATAFLVEAFQRGWSDPEKRHAGSRKAAILLNEAKENFAGHLGIRREQIEILSDTALGFHLGLTGLLQSDSTLYYPAIARSEVFAVADGHSSHKLPTDSSGQSTPPSGSESDVLAWQLANGETGIRAAHPTEFKGRIFADATASGALLPLPERWSSALWSSRAWQGPAGLGIFAIADRSIWRNPLPHFDQRIGSTDFSLPLAIASAIALDAWVREYREREESLHAINVEIRNFLLTEIGQVDIAGSVDKTLPHLLSFSLLYVDAEMLATELDRRGFAVDSGSACNSANMEPSHVLSAMGLLTHGNIRVTLHNLLDRQSVLTFLQTLKALVFDMRS